VTGEVRTLLSRQAKMSAIVILALLEAVKSSAVVRKPTG
jgi:hypothetical protein